MRRKGGNNLCSPWFALHKLARADRPLRLRGLAAGPQDRAAASFLLTWSADPSLLAEAEAEAECHLRLTPFMGLLLYGCRPVLSLCNPVRGTVNAEPGPARSRPNRRPPFPLVPSSERGTARARALRNAIGPPKQSPRTEPIAPKDPFRDCYILETRILARNGGGT